MADETEIKFRFTPKGQQISAAILGGKDKIEFTKAVSSIDVHINDTDADVANIIDLDNKKQIVDISDTVAVKNNVVQIPIKFEKNKITEDYQMNTIGIYAKYQEQEFLYAFGALKYPLYMHHTDDSGVFKMYTYITVGTVANVVIKTDDTENVSRDDLNKILADYPTKGDLAGKANVTDVYTKDQVDKLVAGAGQTKSVNGHKPDADGNIDLNLDFAAKTDLGNLYGMTDAGVKKKYSSVTVNPDAITDTGIYKISSCTITGSIDNTPISGVQWGWLIVLNYDETTTTNGLYQYLIINGKTYARLASLQYKTFPTFKTIADSDALATKANIKDTYTQGQIDSKLTGKANGSDVYTKVQVDDKLTGKVNTGDIYTPSQIDDMISKAGKIKSVNNRTPDSSGNITLPDLNHPDKIIQQTSWDLDSLMPNTPAIYQIKGTSLTTSTNASALNAINSDLLNQANGYLVQYDYNGTYAEQKLILYSYSHSDDDVVYAFRCIGYRSDGSVYHDNFKKMTTDDDVYNKQQADSRFGGAIKKIDGYSPDSNGNINLDGTYVPFRTLTTELANKANNLSRPNFTYANTTIDIDKVLNAGTYLLGNVSLSSTSHALDNVTIPLYKFYYLIVEDGNFGIPLKIQFLLVIDVNNMDITLYKRVILTQNDAYGKFKAI